MKLSKRRKDIISNAEIVVHPAVSSMTFKSALDAFLQAQVAANRSSETHKDYRIVLNLFLNYMAKENEYKVIQDIKEEDILAWLAHLHSSTSRRGRPYSPRTIATYHRDVTVFFSWLVGHKYLAVNPMENIDKPKVGKTLIRVFTDEEVMLLDKACDRLTRESRGVTEDERKVLAARDRAILWLLLSTGIRLSEARGLIFSDIDWEKGMIYVQGKGAKERKVPFGKAARQHLNTYIMYWRGPAKSNNDHVFLNLCGKPLNSNSVVAVFMRLKKVSGITDKRVSAHTCRHWFAVNCIKAGMPTIVLKEILGHESWEMIEIYVHLAEQDTRMLYDRYSPADKLNVQRSAKGERERLREWRNARKRSGEGKK